MTRRGTAINLPGLVNGLPTWMRESDFGNSLKTASYTLAPTSVRFRSGLNRDETNFFSYVSPVLRPIDATVVPALALNYVWRNSAGLTWQPIGMLDVQRRHREHARPPPVRRLDARWPDWPPPSDRTCSAIDVGVERDRTTGTSILIAPRIASWFRPRFGTNSNFVLNRFLNSRQLVREDGDTAGAFILPQTFSNLRSYEWGFSIDYARGIRQLVGDSSGVGNVIRRFRPLDVIRRTTRTSTYDLATFTPSLSYILAFGGMSSFLNQEGQSALGATQTVSTQLATGLDFGFGLTITGLYGETTTDRYQSIGGGQRLAVIYQREWPSGQLRFSRPFSSGPVCAARAGGHAPRAAGFDDAARLGHRRGGRRPTSRGTSRPSSASPSGTA